MCGFVAVCALRSDPVSADAVERGVAALAHRGPDGQGSWVESTGRAALGHARLSIIDLEGGQQPISSTDGQHHLVVNGEFYDFERLLGALRTRGNTLRSRSDSEVALHLYRESGVDCLSLLRGEFAFALWDAEKKALFAARDRFGIKPLFYAVHDGKLWLASEIKALFAAGVPARWTADGMFVALHFCMGQDQTLYGGIKQVPPGHYLWVQDGQVSVRRYWDIDYTPSRKLSQQMSETECIHHLGGLLEQAVRVRTRADVPIACYLSGGVDSASVLGLASRLSPAPVTAFTVAFDHPDYDESPLAEEMAAHVGADFHRVEVDGNAYVDVFEDAVAAGEMPHYNGHGPARYLLSRAVSQAGFKVALGGEGADEVFAGYHFVRAALAKDAAGASGGQKLGLAGGTTQALQLLRRLATRPSDDQRALAQTSPMLSWLSRGVGFPADLQHDLQSRFTWLRGLLAPELAQRQSDPYRAFLSRFPWASQLVGRPAFRMVLYIWMRSHFPNYVLAAERLDMAHAVELRLPFLDHHVFEFARDLPASLLYKNQENKYLLRQIMAPEITDAIRLQPKRPFFAPPTALTPQSPLTQLAQDLIRSEAFTSLPFFNHAAVRKFVDDFDTLPQRERASLDPLLYLFSSLAILQARYRPSA